MTLFQLFMLGAAAFFALKIYEHIHTLQDPEIAEDSVEDSVEDREDVTEFSPDILVEKADNAYMQEDLKEALMLLSEANAQRPKDSEILFKIGYILQKDGNDTEAIKYYKEALAVDEKSDIVHNALASIYRKNGDYNAAKLHLQTSIEIDDQNPITYYNYGNLLVDMQNIDKAIAMYQKALALDGDFTEAQEELEKLTK